MIIPNIWETKKCSKPPTSEKMDCSDSWYGDTSVILGPPVSRDPSRPKLLWCPSKAECLLDLHRCSCGPHEVPCNGLAPTTVNEVLFSHSPMGFNAPEKYQFVALESSGRCLKPETTQKFRVEACIEMECASYQEKGSESWSITVLMLVKQRNNTHKPSSSHHHLYRWYVNHS